MINEKSLLVLIDIVIKTACCVGKGEEKNGSGSAQNFPRTYCLLGHWM
jgi:hypothetical protein